MADKLLRCAIAIAAACAYMSIAAMAAAAVDRYSPLISWQSAVVFGGGAAVAVAAYRWIRI